MTIRTFEVSLDEYGTMTVKHASSGMVGRVIPGRIWTWKVLDSEMAVQQTASGDAETQWAAYGELLCKMYELAT